MNCAMCSFEARNGKSLGLHVSKRHGIKPKEYYDRFLKESQQGICKKCGKETVFESLTRGYREFCSIQCMTSSKEVKQRKENTSFQRFGVRSSNQAEEVKQKKKETCLKHYGVETPFQNDDIKRKFRDTYLQKHGVDHPWKNPSVQQQIKDTSLERYGVENALQSKEIQQKCTETMLKRYGVKKALQNESIKQQTKQTCVERYGVDNPLQSRKIKGKAQETFLSRRIPEVLSFLKSFNLELLNEYTHTQKYLKLKCTVCGALFETSYFYVQQGCGRCPTCFPKYKSIAETNLTVYLKSLNLEVVENSKQIISPLELDVFIPDRCVAVEYNGLYWHSELMNKDRNYHIGKLNMCQDRGIRLIQIFEDEWLTYRPVVEARLKQILGVNENLRIHARKCTVGEVSGLCKNEFLNKYHLQGSDNSPVSLGAFYNSELVAVMTFNHGSLAKGVKKRSKHVWELNRYCCNYAYRIPGIASKLLSYFKKHYEWKTLYSYADRRWSIGDMYLKLGFNLVGETGPNYWYLQKGNTVRIHRFALRKRPEEPKDIPEHVLRMQEGYYRIWDCGSLKFVMINEEGNDGSIIPNPGSTPSEEFTIEEDIIY